MTRWTIWATIWAAIRGSIWGTMSATTHPTAMAAEAAESTGDQGPNPAGWEPVVSKDAIKKQKKTLGVYLGSTCAPEGR